MTVSLHPFKQFLVHIITWQAVSSREKHSSFGLLSKQTPVSTDYEAKQLGLVTCIRAHLESLLIKKTAKFKSPSFKTWVWFFWWQIVLTNSESEGTLENYPVVSHSI